MAVVTQADLDRFKQELASKDRAAFYLDYYNVTGSQQALVQAQISSFSGIIGSAAEIANDFLSKVDSNYPKGGVEDFSLQIATNTLAAITANVAAGGSGNLSDAAIFGVAQQTWTSLGLQSDFPGNTAIAGQYLEALVTGDTNYLKNNTDAVLSLGNIVGLGSSGIAAVDGTQLAIEQSDNQYFINLINGVFGMPTPVTIDPNKLVTSNDGLVTWRVDNTGTVVYGSVQGPSPILTPSLSATTTIDTFTPEGTPVRLGVAPNGEDTITENGQTVDFKTALDPQMSIDSAGNLNAKFLNLNGTSDTFDLTAGDISSDLGPISFVYQNPNSSVDVTTPGQATFTSGTNNQASTVSLETSPSGTAAITITGEGGTLNISDEAIKFADNASATIVGNNDTIVTGTGDTFDLVGNYNAIVGMIGGSATIDGSNNAVQATNTSVTLGGNETDNIVGSSNKIFADGGDTVRVFGTYDLFTGTSPNPLTSPNYVVFSGVSIGDSYTLTNTSYTVNDVWFGGGPVGYLGTPSTWFNDIGDPEPNPYGQSTDGDVEDPTSDLLGGEDDSPALNFGDPLRFLGGADEGSFTDDAPNNDTGTDSADLPDGPEAVFDDDGGDDFGDDDFGLTKVKGALQTDTTVKQLSDQLSAKGDYPFNGFSWGNQRVITWSLANLNDGNQPSNQFSSFVNTPAEQNAVEAAMQQWAKASGITFREVADSPNADIRIGFADLNTASTAVLGETTVNATPNGQIEPGVVVRLEDPAQLALTTNAQGQLQYADTDATLQQNAAKEIGHALGLADNNDPKSIENIEETAQDRKLDPADIANIQTLYGKAAATTVASATPATGTADDTIAKITPDSLFKPQTGVRDGMSFMTSNAAATGTSLTASSGLTPPTVITDKAGHFPPDFAPGSNLVRSFGNASGNAFNRWSGSEAVSHSSLPTDRDYAPSVGRGFARSSDSPNAPIQHWTHDLRIG